MSVPKAVTTVMVATVVVAVDIAAVQPRVNMAGLGLGHVARI